MRKTAAFLCAVLLLSGLLVSCGRSSTKESRVELTRGGKIIEYTVDDFSALNYDIDELKEFIEDEISAYKEDNKGRIKVKTEKVRKDTAYLTIRYNKPETYAAFNTAECFSGTILDAVEAGYDFSMRFIMAMDDFEDEDEELEEELEEELADTDSFSQITVSGSTVLTDDTMKVLIIETEADVTVPGEVQYYYSSRGQARLKSKDTVSISVSGELAGENNLVYVLYN